MKRFYFFFLALFVGLLPLHAQQNKQAPVFKGQPAAFRTSALDNTFANYQVFDLDIAALNALARNQQRGQALAFGLELGTQFNWNLRLTPNQLFKPGFQFKVLTEHGIEYQTPASNTVFKGYVEGSPEDGIRMTISKRYIRGAIHQGGQEFFIEPVSLMISGAPKSYYVVYERSDVLVDPELECGVTQAEERRKGTHGHHAPGRVMEVCSYEVELALAAAFDMVQKFGDVPTVQQHILDITNLMEDLYDPFNIDYNVVDIVIPASAAADPWSTSAFMDILLPDFATWGNTPGNFNQHDIGQLWVARDVFRGSIAEPVFNLIGRADGIGVVCTGDRYNVCEDFDNSLNCLRSLSAHEIGHLWDGIHGASVEGTTIMSPTIVCAATDFTADNTTRIQNHIDSRTCLAPIDTDPPVAVCQNPSVALLPDGTYTFNENEVLDFGLSSDNCGFSVTSISPASVNCAQANSVVPVMVTITDESGLSDVCTANVSVSIGTALPAPLVGTNVGNPGSGNTYEYNPCTEEFTIDAGAANNGMTSDNIAYINQDWCGDGQIVLKLESLSGPGYGGPVIRETAASGSKMAALYSDLSFLLRWESRTVTNGPKQINAFSKPLPSWLRLQRQGNWILGYSSPNGSSWSLVTATMVPMNACVKVGMAAHSYIPGQAVTAVFSNVSIGPSGSMAIQLPEAEVPHAGLDKDIRLFPNPAANMATLDFGQAAFDQEGPVTLRLRNQYSQLLEERQLEAGTERFDWDVSRLTPGMYFIEVHLQGQSPQLLRLMKAD